MTSELHPVEQIELMAYLDGELPASRAAEVADHVEHCGQCRVSVAESRALAERLDAWQIDPTPPSLSEPVVTALRSEIRSQTKSASSLSRLLERVLDLPRWAWAVSVAMFILFLVGVGTVSHFHEARPAQTTAFYNPSSSQHEMQQSMPVSPGLAGSDEASMRSQTGAFSRLQLYSKIFTPPASKTAQELRGGDAEAGPPVSVPMIVRTASLTLVSKDFTGTREALEQVIRRHSGYSSQLSVGSDGPNSHKLTATFRVPSNQLDAAITEIKQLAQVVHESQGGEEVTDQYVNLTARLTNARRTEQTLLDILEKRTGKLSDVLEVEQELSQVREQIERMEGELKSLQNRVSFATLQVELSEEYKAQLELPPSLGGRLRNAFVEGFKSAGDSIVGVAIFFLNVGPFLLVWAVILLVPCVLVWRRLRSGEK